MMSAHRAAALADLIAQEQKDAYAERRSFRHRLILPELDLIEKALREFARGDEKIDKAAYSEPPLRFWQHSDG